MLLRKLVEVEASPQEVRDYLRGCIAEALRFRAGGAVRIKFPNTGGTTEGVAVSYATSDNTLWVAYCAPGGTVRGAWYPLDRIELIERMPADWQPSGLAAEAAAAAIELTEGAELQRAEIAAADRANGPSAWTNLGALGRAKP